MDWYQFEREMKNLGFFGRIKIAFLTYVLGEKGVQNQHMLENGSLHGKMNLFQPREVRCANGSGTSVIWIAPADIEVFWTEDGPTENESRYFFRSKSGKDFEVSKASWFRIMHGVDYVLPKE